MSRHLDNLERLCNDLHSRYGELDPMVLQIKSELETCKRMEASNRNQHDWTKPYRTLVRDQGSEFMQRANI